MESSVATWKKGREKKIKRVGQPRSKNVTDQEKHLLMVLIELHKAVLENKKTDATSTKVCFISYLVGLIIYG